MKILIVSTSIPEMEIISSELGLPAGIDRRINRFNKAGREIVLLRTDAGIFSMTYHLTAELGKENYDLIINAGICGSYSSGLKPGEVVRVREDRFADIGAVSGNSFSDLFDLGLIGSSDFPFRNGILSDNPGKFENLISSLPAVFSNTVNLIPFNPERTGVNGKLNGIETETMEGAAFFYVCAQEKGNYFQLRAVSNFIEERDKTKWMTKTALQNLGKKLNEIVYEDISA